MRRVAFASGEYYHLYNRGVDKRTVFTCEAEYKRFASYLRVLNDARAPRLTYNIRRDHLLEAKPLKMREPLVAIGAYCLMPNHFHIYATPLVEGGISKFMQRLQTAYTMYFNEKHERSGSLFQGTFKARHVHDDAYAKYLFSYIHLNPAKLKEPEWKSLRARDLRGLRAFLRTYKFSSLGEYMRKEHVITNPSEFPDYFSDSREVDDHIDLWLQSREFLEV